MTEENTVIESGPVRANIMALPLFQRHLEETKNLSESSIAMYVQCIKRFLSGKPDIGSPSSYVTFLVSHAVKKRSYHYVASIKHFVEFYVENTRLKNEILKIIQERGISPQQPVKYMKRLPLNEEEINSIIGALHREKHKIMTYIMYMTGIRIGDVLRIHDNGIYFDKVDGDNVLKISMTAKGQKERIVWVWQMDVANIIFDYVDGLELSNTGYIFSREYERNYKHNDKKVSNQSSYQLRNANYHLFWMDLKESMIKMGIKTDRFAPHEFRRIYAKKAWEKFHDIDVLQNLMGHERATTTLRYLKGEGFHTAEYSKKLQMD